LYQWRQKFGGADTSKLSPEFNQTHNYTGERGPIDSPAMPVCVNFRGLAEGHRSLSERGIIAAQARWSTNNSLYFRDAAISPDMRGFVLPENRFFPVKIWLFGRYRHAMTGPARSQWSGADDSGSFAVRALPGHQAAIEIELPSDPGSRTGAS